MTDSRKQARDEGKCARATERGMETCECFGDVTSKSIDRFAVETLRKRLRNLLALNVPRRQAIRYGKSRKGLWHMAMTIASGVGMTHAWLAEQGVLSFKSLWAEVADLRGTARFGPACRAGVGRVPGNGHPYPISAFFLTKRVCLKIRVSCKKRTRSRREPRRPKGQSNLHSSLQVARPIAPLCPAKVLWKSAGRYTNGKVRRMK